MTWRRSAGLAPSDASHRARGSKADPTLSALPTPCTFPRRTAEPVHRVRHRFEGFLFCPLLSVTVCYRVCHRFEVPAEPPPRLRQLLEMGFTREQAADALQRAGGSVEEQR